MTRLKLTITLETGAKKAPVVDASEGMSILHEAQEQASDPTISPDDASRRRAWLGGAVRMFSVLTGRPAESVLGALGSTPAPAAPAPAVPARYADVVAAATPVTKP